MRSVTTRRAKPVSVRMRKGLVIATRLDLDEKGGAVVDVMVSPIRESRGKPVISTNKELKQETGECNEYSALRTSGRRNRARHPEKDHAAPASIPGKPMVRLWTRPVRASERFLRGYARPSGTQTFPITSGCAIF